MMMCLGQFVFSLDTLAYQQLRRSASWNHPSNPRVGDRPAKQYTGQGEDTISLSGVLVPEFKGTTASIETLRYMGDLGDAYALVDGTGMVYGSWLIEGLDDEQTFFTKDGTARRIDFTVNLSRTDDWLASPAGQSPGLGLGGLGLGGVAGYLGEARGYLNAAQGAMNTAKGYLSTASGLSVADAASYVKSAASQAAGAVGGAIGGVIGKL